MTPVIKITKQPVAIPKVHHLWPSLIWINFRKVGLLKTKAAVVFVVLYWVIVVILSHYFVSLPVVLDSDLQLIGMQLKSLAHLAGRCELIRHEKWTPLMARTQAKLSINRLNRNEARYALRLGRKHFSTLTGLVTGHDNLNWHLSVIGLQQDPLCPLCQEEHETSTHLIDRCSATMLLPMSIFRLNISPTRGTSQYPLVTTLGLSQPLRGLYDLKVLLGKCFGHAVASTPGGCLQPPASQVNDGKNWSLRYV